MHDLNGVTQQTRDTGALESSESRSEVVSTHVLVSEDQVEKLRELSMRTRVAQSEYLREAVDDLLRKYSTVMTQEAAGVRR
jgi:hypothetical protein